MKKVKKTKPSKAKGHSKQKNVKFADYDEEISEDDIDIDDFPNNNNVKNNKTGKKNKKHECGELWHYIYDNESDNEDNDNDLIDSQDKENEKDIENDEDGDKVDRNGVMYDRLEDSVDISGNLLDFDQVEELSSSYDWITKSRESNEQYKALIKKFKQIDKEVPQILTSESQSRLKRIERKAQYESTKRFLTKKWAPIVKEIRKSDNIVYGSEHRSEPTVSTICTNFAPETELEKELNSVGDELETKMDNTALVRAIISREQKKNKRINRIKSKRWHKRQKQRDLQMAAKLLGKIDDPELATEIKNTFERKRAEKRILRKKEAQSKWAKMALRYGGKDLLPLITSQQNDLKQNYDLIDQTIKENEDDSSDQNDDDSVEGDDDHSVDNENEDSIPQYYCTVHLYNCLVPIPNKGLFNLTFMKNAIQNQREQLNNEDESVGDSDQEDKDSEVKSDDELDYKILVNNEGIEVDEQINKFNNLKKDKDISNIKLEEIYDKEELEREEKELMKISYKDQFDSFKLDQDKTSETIRSVGYTRANFTSPLNNTSNIPAENNRPETTNIVDKNLNKKLNVAKRSNNTSKEISVDKCVDKLGKDNELDNLINELKVDENEKNKEFVKQMFITRPDEEDYLEDEEDEEEKKKVTNMAGWGSWTGHNIINGDNKSNNTENNESKVKKKSRVKINTKKDPKLSKYYIHKLEHPYTSRNEYNSNMEIPIGPEWNTLNMHQKLIKPKKMVKIGSVIMPLGLEKILSKTELMLDYNVLQNNIIY
ncbi:uncharacterized protein TA06990 [Theileria annulata]|uniref:U3 small nucleolar RNA-associated protein 14 n=1 Tax=Theileria annulata TaxID=5874 RepID=Q4UHW9_THEAN|nr:uncharacterized protein TA06990 [Theileria annulata]CAI73320.1 hypothetical protein, conserved [Theileria annulata]|eukprot:XP_953997.1 hypothetical protein, conserved [Theileria annulata]